MELYIKLFWRNVLIFTLILVLVLDVSHCLHCFYYYRRLLALPLPLFLLRQGSKREERIHIPLSLPEGIPQTQLNPPTIR